MRIPRVFINVPVETGQDLSLDSRASHYIGTVLRMKPEAEIIIFNGSGLEYRAVIRELGRKEGVISVLDCTDPGTESALETILGIGISRGERMDYVIQKSTEMGVNVIQPLFMEYCEVKLDARRAEKRIGHWRQISIGACEQSGRVIPPSIMAPQSLDQWLENLQCPLKLLLDRDEPFAVDTTARPDSAALLIGPEGGISGKEKALALGKGFIGMNLGPRILRTETAPVAALSLLQSWWGS